MDDAIRLEQARAIARLMPALMRGLFTLENDLAAKLPLAQLRVCGILREGPRPMSALGRDTGVSVSAMTQIADRLERARLVRRVAAGNDCRVRCLQLTPRGEKMLLERENTRIRGVLAALEHLSPEAGGRIATALETLLNACLAKKRLDAATHLPY